MSNVNDVPMLMVLLSYFSRHWAWYTDIWTVTWDKQNFVLSIAVTTFCVQELRYNEIHSLPFRNCYSATFINFFIDIMPRMSE